MCWKRYGRGLPLVLKGRAAAAMRAWLEAGNIRTGALFRGIPRWAEGPSSKPMSASAIYRMLKSRVRAAGLAVEDFSPHSLRAGFVTEAGRQGTSISEVMRLTGHQSVDVAMTYYREGDVEHLDATNLLDDAPDDGE